MQWQFDDPGGYLTMCPVIDGHEAGVDRLASELATRQPSPSDYARVAFEFVRDEIDHSFDVEDPRVSISASETLRNGVGLCYAKAHLLTALLRHRGIAAGLCYQRLTDDGRTFVIHGLVALRLDGRWSRQDPRGNRAGVDARFNLTEEQLAWSVRPEFGERDDPLIHAAPSPAVLAALRSTDDVLTLRHGKLPDWS